MSLSVGIVGLPNAGKSTLFNALLGKQKALTAEYPFATIEPNKGVVGVPDKRLDRLAVATRIGKKKQATVTFIDIAGLIKGAHKGEGLGNQFLGQIREVDLICLVVADFEQEGVEKVGMSPVDDYQTVMAELALKDLDTIRKAKGKVGRLEKERLGELQAMEEELDKKGKVTGAGKGLNLLTGKQQVVVVNVGEESLEKIKEIEETVKSEVGQAVIGLCARLEEQVWQLSEEERGEFMEELGLVELGLNRLIKVAFAKLGLISFFTTTNEKEVRAWQIKKGTSAREAAGVVHSDFKDKFIKARVIDWRELEKQGSWKQAGEAGVVRVVGADYQIEDGQVVEFASGA